MKNSAPQFHRVTIPRTGEPGPALIDPITVSLLPGMEFHRLWGANTAPTFPDDGSAYPSAAYFPPLGGFRFGLFTVPPDSAVAATPPVDMETALKEAEEKLPGAVGYLEPDHPGMHTTDTIDFEYLVSGEVWLELDDGVEVHLRAGDTVVQNGTRHAWRNKSSEPCQMVVVLIGANRGTSKA